MDRAPPVPKPDAFVELRILIGQSAEKMLLSNVRLSIETNGLAPFPTISLFGVWLVLPVPPYETAIVFAVQVPVFIEPMAVTWDKLEFTEIELPVVIVIPCPATYNALSSAIDILWSTYCFVAASVSDNGSPRLAMRALLYLMRL